MQTSFLDYLKEQIPLNDIASSLTKANFCESLITQKVISSEKLAQLSVNYYGFNFIADPKIDLAAAKSMPIQYIEKNFLLPLSEKKNYLNIATFDPSQKDLLTELQFKLQKKIIPVIAPYDKIKKEISRFLYHDKASAEIDSPQNEIIDLTNQLIIDAINDKASDIHLEPFAHEYRIRFRIDGLLENITKFPQKLIGMITTRIKIMAKMDISEKRLPQDGKFNFTHQQKVFDCRVSSCPTIFGEKIVIRFLNNSLKTPTLDKLGLEDFQLELIRQNIQKPNGLILVTGPTGSGKTATLYAMISELNNICKNIVTAEDPVEINLFGINQLNINPKINLDFKDALRSFLRQDPDIIMIGEIRDEVTAKMAITASQTGHLILATLHTNSAIESIIRLTNMGVKAYDIYDSLRLVISQRLVRKICPICLGKHCPNCYQGYFGRTGIFEVLENANLLSNSDLTNLKKLEIPNFMNLKEAGLLKVKNHITTQSEIYRVI